MKKLTALFLTVFMICSLMPSAHADFENTYINSGNLLNDIIEIAETQIGYTHNEFNTKFDFNTEDKTENRSAAFISWCAREAFVSTDAIPETASVTTLYSFFESEEKVLSPDSYTPQKGDIIFISNSEDIVSCGLVTLADNEYVTAIMGDDDSSVKKKMYSLALKKIAGYVTPDYSLKAPVVLGTHITTPSALNLRSEPTTSSAILAKIPKGTVVKITTIENGWGYITYNNQNGWISMDYAEKYDTMHLDASRYGANMKIIDVSKFNGTIDWAKVKEQNVDGVIIRIGFRGTKTKVIHDDEMFYEFYKGAKEQGLHVGCYFYSAATTIDEATEEANHIINQIRLNNLQFDLPVYWDMEDDVIAVTGSDNINEITKKFLSIMDSENIFSGVYTNTTWMEKYYNPAVFSGHALWIADWREQCLYTGDYGMWQYTADGKIDGIEENVDLNLCYINYPLLISDKGFNIPPDPSKPRDKGDVNGDGNVNAADARLALRASAFLQELSDIEFNAADYNSDGKVTAADARLILRKAAGLN